MSISFLITAIATGPSLVNIISGLFHFSTPKGSLLSIIGLVGTTIVPYNLFLHSELVREKWTSKADLGYALKDMIIALVLGGLISMSVIITAAGVDIAQIESAKDLASGLAPVFGEASKIFIVNWLVCCRDHEFHYRSPCSSLCSLWVVLDGNLI